MIESLNPFLFSGFITGEGSFYVVTTKTTGVLTPFFSLILHIREQLLQKKIHAFLGFKGSLYEYENSCEIKIFRLSDHISILIPFFKSYPLLGLKSYNYKFWFEIITLFQSGLHLTPSGKKKIQQLMLKLNRWN